MLRLGEIRNSKGARHKRKRLGRGQGTGRGGTAGKGNKGQLARTGGKVRPGFEGGQMPHFRRLPKKGFSNSVFQKRYSTINVEDIERWQLNEVSIEKLKESGKVKKVLSGLKILGNGEIKRAVKVRVNAISDTAKKKIEKAGGTVEII